MRDSMARWQRQSVAARVLILNGFAFNLGFYMVLPYLAGHLGQGLGLAGWAVGLVLGARVFSQQGLFLLGGALGDRIGYRRAIIAGCALRSVGFALLGWASSLQWLLLGALLSGFAGALFSPCAQAYLAQENPLPDARTSAFALHNLASEVGMLVGPLVGVVLIAHGFGWAGAMASGLFALFTWLQWRALPPATDLPTAPVAWRQVLPQWRGMMANRAFVLFMLYASTYQLLFHQLYLSIPAYIHAAHGGQALVTGVFMVSALVGVLLQMPVSRWVDQQVGRAGAMGWGLACMGCALGLLALPLPWGPQISVLLTAGGLSLGSTLVFPLLSAHLPAYAPPAALASHYGMFAGLGGMVAMLGNVLVGGVLGGSQPPPAWLWLALAACGVLAGWALTRHVRRCQAK